MTFSLIIPCYNVEAFLAECLDSVLAQSFSDWEAICVDDGSMDGSGAIAEDYAKRDARFHVVHQTNGGLSAARNTGLSYARGDYVLFLDSDDVLIPEALAVLAWQIEEHHPEVLTFNAELWYYEENHLTAHYYSRNEYIVHPSGKDYLAAFVHKHHWGPAAACFYCVKHQLIVDHELWFVPNLLHEDELWVPMMLLHARRGVVEIAQTLYWYRMRSQSITHNVSKKNATDIIYIAELLEKELTQKAIPHDVRRSIVYNDAMLGINGLRSLHQSIPFSVLRLAWRNANWKRKVKLLRQYK